MSLHVVYVNYHSQDLLAESLRSLRACAAEVPELVVTIVDNSCDDGAWEAVRALDADADCVRMNDNVGFARACNVGARRQKTDLLLFLNPDTLVPPGTLTVLCETAREHDALVGPRHYADEELLFAHAPMRGAGFLDEAWDLWFARGWTPRRSERYLRDRARLFARSSPVSVRSLSGGCLAMRRGIFDGVSGWSEDYWMYGEDVDLCASVRSIRDWDIDVLYLPHVPIIHFIEGCSRRIPERTLASHHAGREIYKRRHYGRFGYAIDRGITRLTAALLPRRSDPWQRARTLDETGFCAPFEGRPWAIELGRSPLFDNCLTAFPETPRQELPPKLMNWLPPGEYHLRVAGEESRNRWRETGLYRLEVTSERALEALGSPAPKGSL